MNAVIDNRRGEQRYVAPEGMNIVINGVSFMVIDLSLSGIGCLYRGQKLEWLHAGLKVPAVINWPVTGFSLPCEIAVRNLSVLQHGGLRMGVSFSEADVGRIETFLR